MDAIAQSIDKFGRIDVVVNKAVYSLVGSMKDMTDEEFTQILDAKLLRTLNVVRHVMPYLQSQ